MTSSDRIEGMTARRDMDRFVTRDVAIVARDDAEISG